jgi:hypothetical protein
MDEPPPEASAELRRAIRRRSLGAGGIADAWRFAWECDGDPDRLRAELAEQEAFRDRPPAGLAGAMRPGAHPRIFKDGYIAGLREAIALVEQFHAS